jgi:Ca2+/Na+ antiporter
MTSDQQRTSPDQHQAVPDERRSRLAAQEVAWRAEASTLPAEESIAHRLEHNPVLGFAPWIIFWVIGGPSTWETASIAALLAAVLVVALSVETPSQYRDAEGTRPRNGLDLRRIKLLDAGTVIFFAALVIVAVAASRDSVAQLDKYSQAISSGALGLIALGSIVFGHPFTVDYAKESTPPRLWHSPAFKRINLVLSCVWSVVFLLCAIFGVFAVHASAKGTRDWLNWYLPIILIFIAFRLNKQYPAQVRARMQQSGSLAQQLGRIPARADQLLLAGEPQ